MKWKILDADSALSLPHDKIIVVSAKMKSATKEWIGFHMIQWDDWGSCWEYACMGARSDDTFTTDRLAYEFNYYCVVDPIPLLIELMVKEINHATSHV
jgi:hypothetical protein